MLSTPWTNVDSFPKPVVNENGHKFWTDNDAQSYVTSQRLRNVACYFVEFEDGSKTRLITKNGLPVFESTSYEAIIVHLDIMKLAKGM